LTEQGFTNPELGSPQENHPHHCTNCGHELTATTQYCPVCGQKVAPNKIALRAFVSELISTAFNLDSSFFRTLSHLFIPAYLTKEFFRGRQASYYKPLRLFFVSLVILYAVLGYRYFSKINFGLEQDSDRLDYFTQKHLREKLPEVKAAIGFDSLLPVQQQMADSLLNVLQYHLDELQTDSTERSGLNFDVTIGETTKESISVQDLYELEPDSIFRKYEIHGVINQLFTYQLIEVRKNPEQAIQRFITNTSWMMLLLMPALALVMKLLYIRRRIYYAEHLVLLFHYHAAVFTCLTIYFILIDYLPTLLVVLIPLLCLGYLLFWLKRYYQQGWMKTLVKYLLLTTAYLGILLLFIILTAVVSMFF
jgi:hypothetical protein